MAISFGGLGILGAIITELGSGGYLLVIFIGAPVIEEIFKPLGVYLGQVWFPQALRSRLYTAFLSALGGITFGLIESWIYVNIYVDNPSEHYEQFRYTVPVALHATASFIVGLGITRAVVEWVNGRGRLPRSTRRFYVGGVVLHSFYNTGAVLLSVFGVLDDF
ncbi:MAG: PrsW family glutamic-type intramembrane protease [Dehalococcoidia bacterium]